MKTQNLYRILECPPTATAEHLKASYRRLARQRHPDQGGSERAFQSLASAYQILSDPHRRQAYDRDRAAWIAELGAVACPDCGEANRIGRLPKGQHPCCGQCGHPLPRPPRERAPWAEQARELVLDVGDRVAQETRSAAVELGATITEQTQSLVAETLDRGFSVLRKRLGLRPLPERGR